MHKAFCHLVQPKLTRETSSEVENIKREEEELVGSTECKEDWPHVVEPHNRVGSKVSDLVRSLTML